MSESLHMAYGSDLPALRPTITRRDTEVILSYYQSDLAGKTYVAEDFHPTPDPLSRPKLERTASIASSSSAYSSPSSPEPPPTPRRPLSGRQERHAQETSEDYPAVRRRPSKLTDTEQDTRRRAIIDLNPQQPAPLSLENSDRPSRHASSLTSATLPLVRRVGSRSQVTVGLPPDTDGLPLPTSPTTVKSPKTPNSSASASTPPVSASPSSRGVHRKTSSRDIGIVGTRRAPETPRHDPPIFQTPQSRSPSPPDHVIHFSLSSPPSSQDNLSSNAAQRRPPAMSTSVETGATFPPIYSVADAPVSAHPHLLDSRRYPDDLQAFSPVVSSIHSAPAAGPPSSYLYYQPGVHATAGPLPPPPRALFNIDVSSPPPPRPPRLRSPSPIVRKGQDATSTPTSMSAVLAADASSVYSESAESSTSAPTPSPPAIDEEKQLMPDEANSGDKDAHYHVREGAFPPSKILVTPPGDHSVRLVGEASIDHSIRSESPPDILDTTMPLAAEHTGSERSWIPPGRESPLSTRASSRESVRPSPELGLPRPILQEQRFTLRSKKEAFADEGSPSSSPKKGVLTNMKRFSSLPRTPSLHSEASHDSRPSSVYIPPQPYPRKRSRWPDAMWCKDVVAKKTALDRAFGYALKINELAMYECGLGEWVSTTKERGNSRSSSNRALSMPAHPSSRSPHAPQARQISRNSISSEATFPLRPDAYMATDLAPRSIDIIPEPGSLPPALPYPALAQVAPPAPNHRLSTVLSSPSSVRSLPLSGNKSHGFFASLGRNHSLKKEDKRIPNSPAKVLTKLPPANYVLPSRTLQVNAPHVPGGPRAAPGRMQRSQTLMLGPSPSTPESAPVSSPQRRRSNTLKRPSLFGRSGNSPEMNPADTAFSKQVDKLSDLLPHADRDVLAGYLRRAGQDILAIGQYLEDEKNGAIRRA
ncbi:hypothetical protein FA95DRAFT_1065354 [Auriscalpium vulgare]|uniref:Uncharacterized protein n=1 Tax=Auriscalpium vulgare TaxID=40419 RepID=A0ACB8S9C1_9AGAM|nr:hypothetical protein FA95DRAFT_1065354 [Auriscalpium vulgare]